MNSIFSEKHKIPSALYARVVSDAFYKTNEGVLLKHKKRHIESVHEEEKEAVHEKKKLQNEEQETVENRNLLPEKPVFEKAKFEKALRYKCQLCNNTNVYFNEIDELKEHINAIHRTTKLVHEKEEQRFKCSLCESKFPRSNDLRSHISSVHEGIKAASKKAKNSDMKRHIQSVHEGANKESEVENDTNEDLHENNDLETIKENDNPEFMCKICGKDFAGPATLKVGFFYQNDLIHLII